MTLTEALHGVLVVDKPGRRTSHDVVQDARRAFSVRGVGHAGTLDPMATGVLLLLFGEATKLSAYLGADDKTYRTRVAFGTATDSCDSDGRVLETVDLPPNWLDRATLEAALAGESQRREQIPPSVSAIHTGGERAYVRVRRGESPELPARPVRVHSLALHAFDALGADVEFRVSKGYYVRAFARDLGARLGVPAHVAALRRLSSGVFALNEAVTWPPSGPPALIDVATAARRALPATELLPEAVVKVRQGKTLEPHEAVPSALDSVSAWFGTDGELVALGQSTPDGQHRIVRGFLPNLTARR